MTPGEQRGSAEASVVHNIYYILLYFVLMYPTIFYFLLFCFKVYLDFYFILGLTWTLILILRLTWIFI